MKFTFAPESRPLEGFTIKRAIYRGGFGEVYYALTDAGREVALKLLQNNTEVELRGVQQCLNLSHPNLVSIFDVRQDGDGDHWIIMEYIAGETLEAAIRRHPDGMPMQEVRRWLPGLNAGVSFLHDRGIVHRDLKPANVFIENNVVKIGDVGLSKFITPSRRSAQTQSVGTVYYMAPEVAKGKYGKEVDVYSLGVMLYEMLTGRVPFEGESTGEILMKHLSEAPDLSVLPPRIRPVIGKALEKDPAKRYSSVAVLIDQFDRAVLGRQEAIEIPETSFAAAAPDRPAPTTGEAKVVTPVQQPRPMPPGNPTAGMFGGIPAWAWLTVFTVLLLGGIRAGAPWISILIWGVIISALMIGARRISSLFSQSTTTGAQSARSRQTARDHQRNRQACGRRNPAYPRTGNVKLTPLTPRRMPLSARTSHFAGSAAVAALLTLLFTAAVGFVAPDFFANANGDAQLDHAAIGLFAGTSIIAAWIAMAVSKLFEGRKVENGVRRLVLLVSGCLIGAAAWGLDEALFFSWSDPGDAAFVSVGPRPLTTGDGPTLLGYMIFFGTLMFVRRWWWHADSFRPARFRVMSLLLTMLCAWVLSTIFVFPHTWAVVWAAVVSSVVQLSSVWTPPDTRRIA